LFQSARPQRFGGSCHLWTASRLARGSFNVLAQRIGCCHLSGLLCSFQAAGPDEDPRIDAQSNQRARWLIGARGFGRSRSDLWCHHAVSRPRKPKVSLMCRARPRLTGTGLRRCLILSFLLIPTSLFDQRDHLFVPTCLVSERRAQRTARLARQGHRRRRPGLAGASTVLGCRRSGSLVLLSHSWLPHPCAGSAVTAGLR
jgi:hypothetical protein